MHMTLHTWNTEPMSRKRTNREEENKEVITFVNFGMIFMMALKAGFNEK